MVTGSTVVALLENLTPQNWFSVQRQHIAVEVRVFVSHVEERRSLE